MTYNEDTDSMLIQSSTDNSISFGQTKNAQDSDLVLVQRGDTLYKARVDQLPQGGGGELSTVTLAPLTGTPPYEITAVTNIGSIPEGATATYDWYRYDAPTGDAGKTLIIENVSTETSDTYTAGSLDQAKYIGCTVTYLGTTKSETTRSVSAKASIPIADMHGLRFDGTRATSLVNPNKTTGSWTASVWFKCTTAIAHDSTSAYLFGDGSILGLSINSNTKVLQWYDGTSVHIISDALDINKWYHIVVSYDVGQLITYIDGEESSTDSVSHVNFSKFEIGRYTTANYLSGYLSDFYFVDGQVLTPATFGKDYPPLSWGPLDNTEIIANIGAPPESPYDTRPNMDEKWSDGTASGGAMYSSGEWSQAFTGGFSSSFYAQSQGGNSTLTFDNPIEFTKLRFAAGSTSDIKLNGVSQPVPTSSNAYTLIDAEGVESPLRYVTIVSQDKTLSAIEIDGRILADGPANNTQVWSSDYTGTPLTPLDNYGPQFAFDGYLPVKYNTHGDGKQWSYAAATQTLRFNFNGLDDVSSVKIWYVAYRDVKINDANKARLRVNNIILPIERGDAYNTLFGKWITADVTGTGLQSIEIDHPVADESFVGISAVYADDVLLLDGDYSQWNTSQVWSKGCDATNNPAQIFDGKSDTYGWTSGAPVTFTFPDSANLTGLVQINVGAWGGTFTSNETTGSISGSGLSDLYTATVPLTSLTITRGAGDTTISQIIVGGKVLVDAASFGDNGFYLPFDPAATGQIWSSQLSDGATFVKNYGPEKAFNGLTVTDGGRAVPSTASVIFNFGGIPITTGLSISVGSDGSGVGTSATFKVNGVDVKSQVSAWQKAHTEFTAITGFTQLDTIEIGKDSDAAYTSLYGVKVDGKLLIDHNNIGVDASGNDNNFHDENFAVGGNTSQVWSNTLGEPRSTSEVATMAFDGRTDTDFVSVDIDPLVWNITLDNVETLDIQLRRISQAITSTLTVTGDNITSTSIVNSDANKLMPITITNPGNSVGNISITSSNANTGAPGIAMVIVNGEILIDANQQDTVLDTPMYNYAVLNDTTGYPVNGNLEFQAPNNAWGDSNMSVSKSSGTYYFENVFTGNNSQASNVSNGQYNAFGWINSDSPIGPDSGPSEHANNSVILFDSGFRQEFDGTRVNTLNTTVKPFDILGFLLDIDNQSYRYFVNGVQTYSGSIPTNSITNWTPYLAGYTHSTDSSWNRINAGQQSFAGYNVTDNGDGTVTVEAPDNSPYGTRPNYDQVWSSGSTTGAPYDGSWTWAGTFDGDINNGNGASASVNGIYTITFPDPLSIESTVGFLTYGGTQNLSTIYVNGKQVKLKGVDPSIFRKEELGITELVSVGVTDQQTLVGMYVDGRLLVDGPANNDQLWSSYTTTGTGLWYSSTSLPTLLFDGNIGTYLEAPLNDVITFEPPGGIDFDDKVEVYFHQNTVSVSYNDGGYQKSGAFQTWFTVAEGGGRLDKLVVTNSQIVGGDGWTSWAAIRVDGGLLRDSGDQWNTSQVWSSGTDPDDWGDLVPVENLFDGNLSTYTYSGTPDVYTTISWSAITANESIRVYGRGTENSWQVIVDGSPVSVEFSGNTPSDNSWRTLDTTFPCQVTGIQNNNPGAAYAIEVDGKMLVDPAFAGGSFVCNKLQQTWEEQQGALFRELRADVKRYRQLIQQLQNVTNQLDDVD